jgi:hypothetical protein
MRVQKTFLPVDFAGVKKSNLRQLVLKNSPTKVTNVSVFVAGKLGTN